jgi:hypothetical protein
VKTIDNLQARLAEVEVNLKTVLDREAETHRRHDARLDKVEAERDDAVVKRAAWELAAKIAEARVKELEAQPAPTHQIVVWAEGPHFLAQDVARDIMTQGPTELEAWERLAALIAVEVYGATVSWTDVQAAPIAQAWIDADDTLHMQGRDGPEKAAADIYTALAGIVQPAPEVAALAEENRLLKEYFDAVEAFEDRPWKEDVLVMAQRVRDARAALAAMEGE